MDKDSHNRREFLKKAGVAGLTIGLPQPQERSTENEKIPYLHSYKTVNTSSGPERKPVYKTLTRQEWEEIYTTQEGLESLGEKLEDESNIPRPHLRFTGMDDSPTGFGVEVILRENYEDKSHVESIIPRKIRGRATRNGFEASNEIPVRIETPDIIEENTDCYDSSTLYDNVSGAAPILLGAGGDNLGTIAGPFNSNEYGDGWVTAGHVAGGNNVDVFHEVDGVTEKIGVTRDYTDSGYIDCTFIEPTGDIDPIEWIASSDYTSNKNRELESGVLTDDALRNHVDDQSWDMNMQGQTSCRVSTYVDGVIEDIFGNVQAVTLDTRTSEGGDSGGPYFLEVYDSSDNHHNAKIGGVHIGKYDSNGDDYYERIIGTSAETVENELGGTFY